MIFGLFILFTKQKNQMNKLIKSSYPYIGGGGVGGGGGEFRLYKLCRN